MNANRIGALLEVSDHLRYKIAQVFNVLPFDPGPEDPADVGTVFGQRGEKSSLIAWSQQILVPVGTGRS